MNTDDPTLLPRLPVPDYRGSGKLQDMVALITGADSGIGRAVAVLFAREGADVAVACHASDRDALETQRCVQAEGRRCLLLQGDVRGTAWCNAAVQRTVEAFGKLDVLVNNAALQEHAESLVDLTDERLQETLDTNVGDYLRMARAALPHLRQGSSIINTDSVTPGAIHALTEALAANLLDRGIRVNAVAPGPVWTPLNFADSPAGKVAQPEELSPAYVFLASPVCAGYITGIVLPVTGSVGAI